MMMYIPQTLQGRALNRIQRAGDSGEIDTRQLIQSPHAADEGCYKAAQSALVAFMEYVYEMAEGDCVPTGNDVAQDGTEIDGRAC
jgi:hypothetical protein